MLAVVASTADAGAHARRPAIRCDSGYVSRLKTLSDRHRTAIRLRPVTTTIKALAGKTAPGRRVGNRMRGYERQVWRLVAQITLFRLDANGTIQLVLFDDGTYMQAEIPAIACIPRKARDRSAMVAVRAAFGRCGPATLDWQPLGSVAYLNGVGYWGRRGRGSSGLARNGATLSPVVRFVPLAGCGA
jgi:hypothetical protein